MIWVTVSSSSYFCWLYRTSPSSAAKNIINWFQYWESDDSSCVKLSLALLVKGVCYDQRVLLTKLLAFALLHFTLQGQTCLLCQVRLHFLPLHSNSLQWKMTSVSGVNSRMLYVFIYLVNFSFFGINEWSIELDYCDVEWFALEMNWDHPVAFESLYARTAFSISFVNYEGYSNFSKGFLPTVVDIMVIWIELAHSHPFQFTDS